ncbi:MAG: hypothetical protein J6386_22975 [Candidatus Synoicihabitans palmerolidicus]|nr:hypothetical protein [Candidatus Synoicihabitans palmerolidicus]
MSLNRCEQLVSDYVEQNPEEHRFWFEKVRALAAEERDDHVVATRLAEELWYYVEERAAVASPFRDMAEQQGLRRISMKNLAEHWLRLWVGPRPKRKKPSAAEF